MPLNLRLEMGATAPELRQYIPHWYVPEKCSLSNFSFEKCVKAYEGAEPPRKYSIVVVTELDGKQLIADADEYHMRRNTANRPPLSIHYFVKEFDETIFRLFSSRFPYNPNEANDQWILGRDFTVANKLTSDNQVEAAQKAILANPLLPIDQFLHIVDLMLAQGKDSVAYHNAMNSLLALIEKGGRPEDGKAASHETAMKLAECALRDFEHELLILYKLGCLFLKDGALIRKDLAFALHCFLAAQKLDPKDAALARQIGDVHKELGQLTEAEMWYRNSLKLRPDSYHSRMRLGILFVELKKYAEARVMFEEASKLEKATAETFYQLGNAFFHLQQFDAAIQALRTSIIKDPNVFFSQFLLGKLLIEKDDLASREEAARCLKRAAEIDPASAEAKRLSAEARRLLEKTKKPDCVVM